MPFTLLVVGAAVAASLVRGGRLRRIALADVRGSWLVFTGLALQVGVEVAAGRGWLAGPAGSALLLASQALVLVWVVRNWFRPGMLLIGIGLLLNATVIAANGAMPVDPDAIRSLGLSGAEPPPGKHELLTESTRLAVLADRFPLPPLRTIISVGDVVLAAGLVPLVHHLLTYRPPVERRGGPRRDVELDDTGRPMAVPDPGQVSTRMPAARRSSSSSSGEESMMIASARRSSERIESS